MIWIFVIILGVLTIITAVATIIIAIRDYFEWELWGILTAFFLVVTVLLIVGGGLSIANAKEEFFQFKNTAEILKDVIESGSNLENVGVMQNVLAYNDWLTSARANKSLWGRFSRYYYCDLDSLDYILLN